MASSKPIIIFHSPCPDGFGAAYAAWKKFGAEAEYVGLSHGNALHVDVRDRDVFILDFSFKRNMMDMLASKARTLLVIDHHKTAQEDLAGFPHAIFDMQKSGARLAWEFFHPFIPVTPLLLYVEDRDLWNWSLPGSENFLSYLDTQPQNFTTWDQLASMSYDEVTRICEAGAQMNAKFGHLASALATSAERVHFCGVVGHRANIPAVFTSKVGEILYEKNGTFALLWRIEFGVLAVSLRAKKGGVDVSQMAKAYGGGGHAAAAAFKIPINSPSFNSFMKDVILQSF